MMNSTPEDRGSQSPIGTNGTPEDWDRQTQTSNKSLPAFSAALGGKKAFEDKMAKGLTSADLGKVMEEINSNREKPEAIVIEVDKTTRPVNIKLEETKKLITNFKEKVANYPKHLSYEGSVVLCVMLSMKEIAYPDLVNLPMDDQTLIRSLVPSKFLLTPTSLKAVFDGNKDFILTFKQWGSNEEYTLTMVNSVAHPRPEDLKDMGEGAVSVEKDGDKIAIGGHIKLNPRTVRIIMGKPAPEVEERESSDPINAEEKFSSKRSVAGRNAYEIRADVLQMALEWGTAKGLSRESEILDVAKKFYQFVENRR